MLVRRTPFFYGWVIVAVAMVTGSLSTGVGVWGLGVFVLPMEEELGWSRTSIFVAFTIRAIVSAVLAPVVGPLMDRKHGPRVAMLASAVALGGGLVYMSRMESLVEYYLLYGVLGSVVLLGAGIALSDVVVAKWFIRKRGRAMAFATAGSGFAPLLFPVAIGALIEAVGWRDAWRYLGIFSAAVLVPCAILVHRAPEDVGLVPDGVPAPGEAAELAQRLKGAVEERSFTAREVLRMRAFWFIILAFAMGSLSMGGFQAQWIPHYQSLGFSTSMATAAIMVYAVFGIIARFGWGMAAERFHVRYAFMGHAMLTAFAAFFLLTVQNTPMLFLSAMFMGLGLGGFFILQPLMLASYFGRHHIGAVRGASRPFIMAATATGPLMVAALYDGFGSYFWAFIAIGLAWIVAAVASRFAVLPGASPSLEPAARGA